MDTRLIPPLFPLLIDFLSIFSVDYFFLGIFIWLFPSYFV